MPRSFASLPVLLPLPLLLLCIPSARASAQAQGPMDDPLLDRMVGQWRLTGSMLGQELRQEVEAGWALQHRFVRIHFEDAEPPADGGTPYEAVYYVGYNDREERYVLHLMDTFGGAGSETLGFGQKAGEHAIVFRFDYASGAFRNTFRWHPDTGTWTMILESRTEDGGWELFAEKRMQRR